MSVRHLSRIKRLRQSIRNPRNTNLRQNFHDEIDRRTQSLKQNAINVPETETGLRDLINELIAFLRS